MYFHLLSFKNLIKFFEGILWYVFLILLLRELHKDSIEDVEFEPNQYSPCLWLWVSWSYPELTWLRKGKARQPSETILLLLPIYFSKNFFKVSELRLVAASSLNSFLSWLLITPKTHTSLPFFNTSEQNFVYRTF